jgi:hypothetical protein
VAFLLIFLLFTTIATPIVSIDVILQTKNAGVDVMAFG